MCQNIAEHSYVSKNLADYDMFNEETLVTVIFPGYTQYS